ncbi:hypothetical protein E2C01_006436 [Portunus trituberculatus]|uniref:Uncharacterized protein n=1 Tax=Portunus trituberculatus TaxID=210409 RepID=A0A5B7CV78_PORTR|nr:hypothetical protein [Portunus trituberculatus]
MRVTRTESEARQRAKTSATPPSSSWRTHRITGGPDHPHAGTRELGRCRVGTGQPQIIGPEGKGAGRDCSWVGLTEQATDD